MRPSESADKEYQEISGTRETTDPTELSKKLASKILEGKTAHTKNKKYRNKIPTLKFFCLRFKRNLVAKFGSCE